jgi:hypothetical protein
MIVVVQRFQISHLIEEIEEQHKIKDYSFSDSPFTISSQPASSFSLSSNSFH